MSEVRVNNIVDYGGKGAPTFDNGAVISGVSSLGNQAKIGGNVTITSGGINVSGVTTATLSGNLTGDVSAGFLTATSTVIGSGVTINAGGLNITGVMTATTFEGSGASMTGVAMTITPLAYNPDVNDTLVVKSGVGIGITFDHRILSGSGDITIREDSGSGTVVGTFDVTDSDSVTIQGRKAIINPSLSSGKTYHINYPSGCFTNTGGNVSYVGTAYTFTTTDPNYQMWVWGANSYGSLGLNQGGTAANSRSSPVQLPGTWSNVTSGKGSPVLGGRPSGELYAWGRGTAGGTGLNNQTYYSSPTQIPGTTWKTVEGGFGSSSFDATAVKTDGTLWSWGRNNYGQNGLNNVSSPSWTGPSSPIQVGSGTDWSTVCSGGYQYTGGLKTDGTLYMWGVNQYGELGQNNRTYYSSPVQIPGTTWTKFNAGTNAVMGRKSDGTLWTWGRHESGGGGYPGGSYPGGNIYRSSPTQIPGTTWTNNFHAGAHNQVAVKTDGTLWVWGDNTYGQLGDNSRTKRSSPVQVPGTTWRDASCFERAVIASKTDNTLWSWGKQDYGQLGQNVFETIHLSSPTQIPGTSWDIPMEWNDSTNIAFVRKDV